MALLVLVTATCAVYAPLREHGFVTYDDPEYIYDNPHVREGLSFAGARWALFAFHSSNWHPVTWVSHMLDCELFGLDAGRHHALGLGLHALNAALLFVLLSRIGDGKRWVEAFFVAGLFALHPLRVESVAWASERKDLLSGLFLFLVCLAYGSWVRSGSRVAYGWALGLFALGLAAKPMLVSLPGLLVLLDGWPLRRGFLSTTSPTHPGKRPAGTRLGYEHWREKLPFLVLSLGSILLTLLSQAAGGALRSTESLPVLARVSNACVATVTYLAKTLAPFDLAYFHPHPALVDAASYSPWSGVFLISLLALLAITACAFLFRKRLPFLWMGWLSYLLLLSPVIGIVQVGEQAWAERYAYLPLIGIYIALVYSVAEAVRARETWQRPVMALGVVALMAMGLRTREQVGTWRDSETLYLHALSVTKDNYAAHHLLGNVYAEKQDERAAGEQYAAALAIRPDYGPSYYGKGLLLQNAGQLQGAVEAYRLAIEHDPDLVQAQLNLGSALATLWQSGPPAARTSERWLEAQGAFEATLERIPEQPDALLNLGGLYLMVSDPGAALDYLERAATLRGDAISYEMLADAYDQVGRAEDAERARAQLAGARGVSR